MRNKMIKSKTLLKDLRHIEEVLDIIHPHFRKECGQFAVDAYIFGYCDHIATPYDDVYDYIKSESKDNDDKIIDKLFIIKEIELDNKEKYLENTMDFVKVRIELNRAFWEFDRDKKDGSENKAAKYSMT